MVTSLSQLTDVIQEDALPSWLKAQLLVRKEELLREINEKGGGVFTFTSPDGEELRLEIKAEKETVAA